MTSGMVLAGSREVVVAVGVAEGQIAWIFTRPLPARLLESRPALHLG